MKHQIKIISMILALILTVSIFNIIPFTVSAAEDNIASEGATIDEANPDYAYEVLDDGTAEITNYYGDGGDITIPSTLGGYTVTSIGRRAFIGCKSLISITFPDSVTSIGSYAFYYCESLTSITIPDSVTSIDNGGVFSHCSSLSSITVSKNNPVYDSRDNCNAIINTATNELVRGCKNTGIPDSVTSIGYYAFEGCTSMTSLTIPDSVTSIINYAFRDCTDLSYINIPGSVTNIGDGAFLDCTSLSSITIPDSVTKIGSSAFQNTAWYNNKSDGLVYAGRIAYKMKGTCPARVEIKDGTVGIADQAFRSCASLTSIDIPDSVTSIGEAAFNYCESLTSIDIPDSVTSIGDYAFQWCTSLTNIYIPNSVKSIGRRAFDDCEKLTRVTIGNSVTSIGEETFYYCTSLTSIIIPNSVTNIGGAAFYACNNLTDVYYTGSEEDWNAIDIDGGNQCLTKATIHYNYTSEDEKTDFDYRVLEGGTAIITKYNGSDTDITIPSTIDGYTVTALSSRLFQGNASLTSVDISDTVTEISDFAFSGCTGLLSVSIPDSVQYIGDGVFSGCTSIESIRIPDSVTMIGKAAFIGCESLKTIEFGKSVTSISGSECTGCPNLTTAIIPRSVTRIGSGAFKDSKSLTVYGYSGSTAEQFANENGFKFVALSDEPEITGDADGDGELTPMDVTNIQLYLSSMDYQGTEETMMYADIDKNGRIEIVDAAFIQRYLAGIAIPYEIG